jgi:hypothetical protein
MPTGAAIVCTFGAVLLLVGTIAKLRNGPRPSLDPVVKQP